MSIRIKELMDTLTQANEAQEAVPAMKAELARLSRALEASQAEANRYKKASEDIGVELSETKAKASDMGRERDEAQFHALELEEKLGVISKALGSALNLVDPPKAREVKAEVKEELAQTPTAQAEETAKPPVYGAREEEEHHEYAYEPKTYQSGSQGYHDGYNQHDYNDHSSQAQEVASPPTPTQGEPGASTSKESAETSSTPTSSLEAAPSTQEASSAQPTTERPPYLGVRWQDKPGYISWDQFISQGGEKPYWM